MGGGCVTEITYTRCDFCNEVIDRNVRGWATVNLFRHPSATYANGEDAKTFDFCPKCTLAIFEGVRDFEP